MGIKQKITPLTALALVCALFLGGCGKAPSDPTQAPSDARATVAAAPAQTGEAAEPQTEETPAVPVNPLTGKHDDTIDPDAKCVGIVVENSPQARPQWGMSTPDAVMEYEVEGGVTRMLWLYADVSRVPESAGPVRSARHDIVELALGMDLLFVHCGGSPMALEKIRSLGGALSDLDGQKYDDLAFIRDKARNVAYEHTLVLKGDKFRAAVASLGLNTAKREGAQAPFVFTDEAAPRTLPDENGKNIRFVFSQNYRFDFTYNGQSGKYDASLNGSPRADDTGTRCAYDNVLVLYTDVEDLNDADGHLDFRLEKGGEGYYLNGGRAQKLRWEKNGESAPLRLLTADGQPLALNPGTSYIGFVRAANASKTVLS